MLQNCPIIFLALRPGVRAGGRGASATIAVQHYYQSPELVVAEGGAGLMVGAKADLRLEKS